MGKATREHETLLIGRIKSGETDLFYELIRPYQRDVFITALMLVVDPADAEEVAQEAILKSFLHLDQFRFEARFRTWLMRIALNEARMRCERDRKRQGLFESLDEPHADGSGDFVFRDFADGTEIPAEAVERKEIRSAVDKAMATLSETSREILVLRDVQQLTVAETSELLGITIAAAKVRLFRARCQMRGLLAPVLGGGGDMAR